VLAIDQAGRILCNGSYTGWKRFKNKTKATFVTVNYYNLGQLIGTEKQILIK
jgi:hypothetical protein